MVSYQGWANLALQLRTGKTDRELTLFYDANDNATGGD